MAQDNSKDHSNPSRVIFPYFQDEPKYQGVTVALLRYIERRHPDSEIDVIDLSRYSNSSSFTDVADLLNLHHPVQDFIDRSLRTNWLHVKKRRSGTKISSQQFKDAVISDLYSMLKTEPLPNNMFRKMMEKKFISNGERIYESTKQFLEKEAYCCAYILNGRHSTNAAFWIASNEFSLETHFWEAGPAFETVYLCNHAWHDFFALREEAEKLDGELDGDDFSEAQIWFNSRLESKGDKTFNRHWNSSKTTRYLNANNSDSRVTYFSSSSDEYMSLGELSPPRLWKNQYEALKNLNLDSDNGPVTLTLRMHPNTLSKSPLYCMREIIKIIDVQKKFPFMEVIWPSERIDSYELIKKSKVVLSSGSTIALESMFMGVPTYHLDHSSFFFASSKTMIDFSQNYQQLKDLGSIKDQRRVALIEITLRKKHERLAVHSEDQVKKWNIFLSAISYRDAYRVLQVATKPLKTLANSLIFSIGKTYVRWYQYVRK